MDKRKFLYYNLGRIENNKRVIISNYIHKNKIEHSENSNGLLLNLSKIDSKHVDFFFDLYNLENKYYIPEPIEIKCIQSKLPQKEKIERKEYELNSLETLIISYSY